MRKPKLSGWLTDEDIRKIRMYEHDILIKMTADELKKYFRKGAQKFLNYKPKMSKEEQRIFGVKNYDEYKAKYQAG
jgi:hypothetical protein